MPETAEAKYIGIDFGAGENTTLIEVTCKGCGRTTLMSDPEGWECKCRLNIPRPVLHQKAFYDLETTAMAAHALVKRLAQLVEDAAKTGSMDNDWTTRAGSVLEQANISTIINNEVPNEQERLD